MLRFMWKAYYMTTFSFLKMKWELRIIAVKRLGSILLRLIGKLIRRYLPGIQIGTIDSFLTVGEERGGVDIILNLVLAATIPIGFLCIGTTLETAWNRSYYKIDKGELVSPTYTESVRESYQNYKFIHVFSLSEPYLKLPRRLDYGAPGNAKKESSGAICLILSYLDIEDEGFQCDSV